MRRYYGRFHFMKAIISPVNINERQKLDLRSGDTVKIWQKIKEGNKTRSQIFEGLVLARKHGKEAGGTFTVRKVVEGIGVERIFPLYSPVIEKIQIVRRAKTRRAKLYHIRDKAAKEIRKEMSQIRMQKVPVVEPSAEQDKKEEETAEQKTA